MMLEEKHKLCKDTCRQVTKIKQKQDDRDLHMSHEHKFLDFEESDFLDVGSLFEEVADMPIWDIYDDDVCDASEAEKEDIHELDLYSLY